AGFVRRYAVPRYRDIGFRHVHGRQHGQHAAHAKTDDADALAVRLQVLDRAAYVLRGGVTEIEAVHVVLGLGRIQRALAAEQVRDRDPVTGLGPLPADTLDLLVHAPPLLDDDDGRRIGAGFRLGVPGRRGLAVGARDFDLSGHVFLHQSAFAS